MVVAVVVVHHHGNQGIIIIILETVSAWCQIDCTTSTDYIRFECWITKEIPTSHAQTTCLWQKCRRCTETMYIGSTSM